MKTKIKTKAYGAKQPVRLIRKPGSKALVPVLSMAQAVKYTGRSYSTLYRHAVEGRVKCMQSGNYNAMFFTIPSLDEYLTRPKQTRPPQKKKGRR